MPWHVYICENDKCGKVLEFQQPAGEQPFKLRYCDNCGSRAKHQIAPPGIIFKASGFTTRVR
jgi:predicted nucleic acid-binding Zn ribbon protein